MVFDCTRDESGGGCGSGLFMEYPLVSTRKHIRSEIRVSNSSLGDSEKDLDDITASTNVSERSTKGGFLNSALTACSCFNIPEEPEAVPKVRLCRECGCEIDEKEGYVRESVILSTATTTIRNNTEGSSYCYECAQINQGRLEHGIATKMVFRDLLKHFDIRKKKKREAAWAEAAKAEEERIRKNRWRLSPFKKKKPTTTTETPDTVEIEKDNETEESSVERQEELQMVFSSPTSLQYRFDAVAKESETQEAAKKEETKQKKNKRIPASMKRAKRLFSKKPVDTGTHVKTVAVSW